MLSLSHPTLQKTTPFPQTTPKNVFPKHPSPRFHLRSSSAPKVKTQCTRETASGELGGLLEGCDDFELYVVDLQNAILKEAEELDASGRKFEVDVWTRPDGSGFGKTCVLEGGAILEKAAANVSIIHGRLTPDRAKAMSSRGRDIDPEGGQEYSAAAMSLVFHSAHPFIPTLRADVRRFDVEGSCWYGGGVDLTPAYVIEEDVKEFHSFWKDVCDSYSPKIYPEFKQWCDRYFYLPARKEHRGIGGLFFDDLDPQSEPYNVESFVREIGVKLITSWRGIVDRRRDVAFSDNHRDWQVLRRGRYIEFNLLYDRGVRFGLDKGRIESIMVSAPPLVAWKYNVEPEEGSKEWELVQILRKPRDWV